MVPSIDFFRGTDRFAVLRRIGQGGMGIVYEAYDRERGLRVALKTMRQVHPEAIYHFKNEFRSLAEISHPNLISLYELVFDSQQWFFTMELLESAVDFSSYLRHGPCAGMDSTGHSSITDNSQPATASPAHETTHRNGDPNRDSPSSEPGIDPTMPFLYSTTEGNSAARLARLPVPADAHADRFRDAFTQLAEGVSALHQAGKLHRDLKPSNALVCADGRVVLLDFGLVAELKRAAPRPTLWAQASEFGGSELTHKPSDRVVAGTIPYMSPEQLRNEELTLASDWYAVGVMLFEALSGRLPFTGKTSEVLRAKQSGQIPSPSDFVAGAPEDLCALCMDLLQADPAARPSGHEVETRLARRTAAAPPSLHRAAELAAETLPFVGRRQQLATLTGAFAHVLSGQTAVCHVFGKSGAGKSALIQRFLEQAVEQAGAECLSGRCYEQESVPYKALDSLVDALARFLLRQPDPTLLLPSQVGALARIFPVLERVRPIADAARDFADFADLRQLRALAFDALRQLLVNVARDRPLILYVDDLQWGDADSAALLSQLLQPPAAPKLLLLLAYRSEYSDQSSCLRELLRLEKQQSAAHARFEIEVSALSAEETRELVTTLLADTGCDPAHADRIVSESGGSAFFVYELVHHLRAGMDLSSTAGIDLDDVLWMRIQRLSDEMRRLIEVVAIAGQPSRLRTIQAAAALPTVPPQLVSALRSEHLIRSTGPSLDDEVETFHDRIRETILARVPAEVRRQHHAALATTLEDAGDADSETLGIHFLHADDPSKASRYFARAADEAIKVLAFDRAESFYRQAAELASSAADRVDIQEKMIHFYTDMARFPEAYEVARRGARSCGVSLPARFMPPLFLWDWAEAKWRLRGTTPAELIDLPTMSDPRLTSAVKLLNAVAKAAYQMRPELCVHVATKAVNLCLKHGNTHGSAVGYMVFGSIFLGGVLENHEAGHEFGRLALALVEKYENERQRAEVNFVVGYFGTSWTQPATEAERLWKIAYQAGLETGDLFHTGCACCGTIMSYHMRGVPLDEVEQQSRQYLGFLEQANLREPLGTITSIRQAIRNLRGQTESRASLSDTDFDEQSHCANLASYGSRHFAHFYYVVKMQLLYLWGQIRQAEEMAATSRAYLKDSPGMLHSAEHHFWQAMLSSLLNERLRSARHARGLSKARRRFTKWSMRCPSNFLHKRLLLHGEWARLHGDHDTAISCYLEAIEAARRFGYLQIEALANQRAASLLAKLGRKGESAERRLAAIDTYRVYGATAYAEALQRENPELP